MVGRKYIRLYAPAHTAALHPLAGGLLANNSSIDLDAWGEGEGEESLARYPGFAGGGHQGAALQLPAPQLRPPVQLPSHTNRGFPPASSHPSLPPQRPPLRTWC